MSRRLPRKLPANPVRALFEACRDGDEDLARALVGLGASFATGSAGPIVAARGSRELFELALEHGLPTSGPAGGKVLEAAIRHGRSAILARLLERGAELAALPIPLHDACGDPPGVVVDAAARREVIDVLLRHGARIDEPSATGLSPLGWAIARGDGGAALHLVTRGASVSGGAELHAAFAAGLVSLARALADRGAPMDRSTPAGFSVAEVVEADLLTPREVKVQYRASGEPQRVRVRLRLARLPYAESYGWEEELRAEVRAIVRLGELGVLGSAASPESRSAVRESRLAIEPAQRGFWDAEQELTVVGVSPAALALAVRSLCLGRVVYPARVVIEGDLPIDDSEESVETERARSWFRDPSVDRLLPPATLPFPVAEAAEDGVLVIVRHEPGAGDRIRDALVELGAFTPPAQAVRPDRGARGGTLAITPGAALQRSTTVRAHVVGDPAAPPAFDRDAARAMALRALVACGGVEHVTWCL